MADQTSPAASPAASPKSAPKTPPKSPSADPRSSPRVNPEVDPEVDPELAQDDQDGDSAVDAASLASSTTSVSESIFEYRKLHGRTYQNMKSSEYWAPNDEQQNEGLDVIHNALLMWLGDVLFVAPIGDQPGRVLDVGTGTGIWAIDFADQYPQAEVIGTDLSPIQPAWVPPNVQFIIEDCLQEWTWPINHFDFVHLRCLYGSIPDWDDLYKKAFNHLKPGGWIQDVEMDVLIQSDHVEFPKDHVYYRWANVFYEAGEKMGRSFAVAQDHFMRDKMIAAGFTNVVEKKIKAAVHGWHKDPTFKHAGLLLQLALDEGLDGFATFICTQILGWDRAEVVLFIAEYRRESRKISNCGWVYVTVVYGQKPLE